MWSGEKIMLKFNKEGQVKINNKIYLNKDLLGGLRGKTKRKKERGPLGNHSLQKYAKIMIEKSWKGIWSNGRDRSRTGY